MKTIIFFLKTFLLILLPILFASCKVNQDVNEKPIQFVTTDDMKISNVTIRHGSIILGKSDEKGNYLLNKELLEPNSILVFEHKDFIKSYKIYGKNNLVKVFMKPRNKAIRIDSKKEKKILLESNISIKIPKNAFTQDGKPYDGDIDITISNIDANNSFDLRSAPAPFIAQDSINSNLIPLTSYGMIEILAKTPKGTSLELENGINIGISIPITTKDTPKKVNLYELNSETGYWSLSGSLINLNNFLVGEITSVNSSWNADDPCGVALICVKIKIQYASGSPCAGAGTGAMGLTYQGFDGNYQPDASGYIEFMVCPNSVFELQNCFIPCTCPGGSGPVNTKIIDLATVTINPTGCTDLGTWIIP